MTRVSRHKKVKNNVPKVYKLQHARHHFMTHIPHYAHAYRIMNTHTPHHAHITGILNHIDTQDFKT